MGGPSAARTPHTPTPSFSHERGTAGPEKGAMAFLDDAEATTYSMLKQVLQNHCTTQTLCFPHTLVGCGALVALVCAQLDETRGDLEPVVAHTLADLKRSTRARRTASPLAPFPRRHTVPDRRAPSPIPREEEWPCGRQWSPETGKWMSRLTRRLRLPKP